MRKWLTENDYLEMFQLDGYQKRVFKNMEKRDGGVAFFEKTGVEFIFQDLKSYLEYLAVAICSKKLSLIFVLSTDHMITPHV